MHKINTFDKNIVFIFIKIASEMPAMFIVHDHKEVALYAEQKYNWLE